jgi:hypothetical protein
MVGGPLQMGHSSPVRGRSFARSHRTIAPEVKVAGIDSMATNVKKAQVRLFRHAYKTLGPCRGVIYGHHVVGIVGHVCVIIMWGP